MVFSEISGVHFHLQKSFGLCPLITALALRTIDKINSKLIDEEEQDNLIRKEIRLFCKTWAHPNICILSEDNTIEIQSWPQLEKDPWSKYTYANRLTLIQYFSAQVHPYHTKNH